MAKIQDVLAIKDGVSGVFEKMSNASNVLAQNLNKLTGNHKVLRREVPKLATSYNGATSAMRKFATSSQIFMGNILADMAMRGVSAIGNLKDSLMSAAEEYSSMKARMELVTGDKSSAKKLNDAIFLSAQRARGEYMAMAETAVHLAQSANEVFKNPVEAVNFTEGVQKLFAIGGTGVEQQKAALLQLGQSLASGVLQGDEFRSIAENAPIIENMIAEQLGVSRGELKALSSQGKITSDLIKRTVLGNIDEINAKFDSIPLKWSDIGKDIKNEIVRSLSGVFDVIESSANNPVFKDMKEDIKTLVRVGSKGLEFIANNFVYLLSVGAVATQRIKGFITSHKETVKGAILILGGMLTWYTAIQAQQLVMLGLNAAATIAKTVADGFATASLLALTVAQEGFNVALAMCPITWIIGLVILAIGAFYGLVAVVNHFAGTSVSATGLITGAFAGMFAMIFNGFILFAKTAYSIAEFFVNVWRDPLSATHNLFADIWNGIAELVGNAVNFIIDSINKVPGLDKIHGKFENVEVSKLMLDRKNIDGGWNAPNLDYLNVSDYGKSGYNFGNTLLDGFDLSMGNAANVMADAIAEPSEAEKERTENSHAIRGALESTTEDLKFLREAAEREAINKYTTATININAGGLTVEGNGETDYDGMLQKFADVIQESVVSGSEVVQR